MYACTIFQFRDIFPKLTVIDYKKWPQIPPITLCMLLLKVTFPFLESGSGIYLATVLNLGCPGTCFDKHKVAEKKQHVGVLSLGLNTQLSS